jgi:hypothetical protein
MFRLGRAATLGPASFLVVKGNTMKRAFGVLACALVLLAMPIPGFPQVSAMPRFGPETNDTFKPFSGMLSTIGNLKVDSCLRVGVKGLTCHFNLPIASVPSPLTVSEIGFPGPVEFDMKNETLWVGAVEFQVQLPRNFSVFLNGEGSAQKAVTVPMVQDPFATYSIPFNGDPAGMVLWNGSKTQWWEVEGGILYNFFSDYYFIVGLRFDQLSLYLNDPRDQSGIYQGFLQYGYQDLYTSDMNVKTWIPYLGIRVKGSNYKGDILYSPFATANVALPFRYKFDNAGLVYPLPPIFGGPFSFQQENYTMNKPGTFLEASFQYCAAIINNFGLDLWAKWSYLSVKGNGNEDSTMTFPFYSFEANNSASAQGALNTYSLSGGLGVSLSL